jgi:pyruvate,water dikinase
MTTRTTQTQVLLNLGFPEMAAKYAELPSGGVGLMRAEFLALSIGKHPQKMLDQGGAGRFIDFFEEKIAQVAQAFFPRPVIYRSLDLKSNEYASLEGGEEYEEKEENPMLGHRGCSRYVAHPESFRLELRALARARARGLTNLKLMLPFVRFPEELAQCRAWIAEEGLLDQPGFELWMMAEVPSTVLLIEEFLPYVHGVSVGSNDLTQLILGMDRDNRRLSPKFDERHPAVLAAMERIARAARARNLSVSICGNAPSRYPELVEPLLRFGFTSFSVAAESFARTVEAVSAAEQKIASEAASKR